MTSQNTDQIEEIKKAEESAKNAIEQTVKDLEKRQTELKNQLNEKKESRKKELQDRAHQKLETAAQEAEQIKKAKHTEAESYKNRLISDTDSKEQDAVNHIVTNFIEYLKS